MDYIDDYGRWLLLGELSLSENPNYLFVPSSDKKIIRYTYLINWEQWEQGSTIRSNCLVRWHYGSRNELVSFYSKLYPKRESNIVVYNLIFENNTLVPRKLEAKLIKQSKKLYSPNANMLPWSLKVEEYQSER